MLNEIYNFVQQQEDKHFEIAEKEKDNLSSSIANMAQATAFLRVRRKIEELCGQKEGELN